MFAPVAIISSSEEAVAPLSPIADFSVGSPQPANVTKQTNPIDINLLTENLSLIAKLLIFLLSSSFLMLVTQTLLRASHTPYDL